MNTQQNCVNSRTKVRAQIGRVINYHTQLGKTFSIMRLVEDMNERALRMRCG